MLSLSAVKNTHKPKKENAAKQVLNALADGEKKSYKLKQKMINRWIQFGTIGDTLPRREAERERVIYEIDENSGNGKLLTGILNDANTILNDYDKDFMKEIGDLAAVSEKCQT